MTKEIIDAEFTVIKGPDAKPQKPKRKWALRWSWEGAITAGLLSSGPLLRDLANWLAHR